MYRKKALIILCTVALIPIVYIALLMLSSVLSPKDPQISNASAFLTDLLQGKGESAESLLSSGVRTLVETDCPEGSLVRCVDSVISPEWGQFEEARFGVGSGSRNTVLFYTFWTGLEAEAVTVVIMMDMENDRWAVIGWRGFVESQGEDFDSGLLRGTRHDNEFPPWGEYELHEIVGSFM